MLTILSGTYLSAHFVAAILLFDTRNIRDIIPKASRKHPESIPKGGGCSLSRILCGSCSHHPPKLLPSCSQLSAGNKGGGGEHVKTDKNQFLIPALLPFSILSCGF